MSTYICPRCNYSTARKSNLKNHITRKRLCKPINRDVSVKDIAKSYGIDISSTENSSVTQNVTIKNAVTVTRNHTTNNDTPPKTDNLNKNVTHRYECGYCNKSFATRQGRYRHKKTCIHVKHVKKKTYTQKDIDKIKQDVKDKAHKEIEKKADIIADKRAQKMVLALVDKLIPNQTNSNNTNNTNNNNSNNTQNNNTLINNNNSNNLKINNYGKEVTNYISDDQLKIMFVDPRNTVIQHIKDTHYHLLHPENFNAKITNYKSKHMKIYEDNSWIVVNKKATICSMYNRHEKIMNNEFERLKSELPDEVRNGYNKYKTTAHSSFHTYNQRLIDTEAVIITGTQQQKNIDVLRRDEVLRLAKEQGKSPSDIFAEHIIAQERDSIIEADRLNKHL